MWDGKIVVIAGGSKGLGLHIADAFHCRGSRVIIVARTQSTVDDVVDKFNSLRPASATGYAIDLSDDAARDDAINSIVQAYGRIDVWVNAVGQSIRADFESTTLESYRMLMEQNFFVSIGCSLQALPHLQRAEGYLINIGSLASKTGWPLVGPYVTSKHALAGFAHQLRLEGSNQVHYLFVCPGPIANSDLSRYEAEANTLNETASRPGAGAPVKAIDPQALASKILQACERRKTELVVPFKSRMLFSILQLWPSLGDWLIRKFFK